MSIYLITTINEEYKVIKPDIDFSDLYEIMNETMKSISYQLFQSEFVNTNFNSISDP